MVYRNGGEVRCSPTLLSMIIAYWASQTGNGRLNQPVVAREPYDYTYRRTALAIQSGTRLLLRSQGFGQPVQLAGAG